LEGRHRLINC